MLEDFKADLNSLTAIQIVRKHILIGGCFALSDEQHYQLKEAVCEHFKIEFNNVFLVGSGKLGFSVKAEKRFQAFSDESDIDIAVISTELFTKVWEEAYLYRKSGAYWPKSAEFFRYVSDGWLRPDKLPSSNYFEFSKTWWDFFTELSSRKQFGPYKIRAGLYHSLFFLQEYQMICVNQCIDEEHQ